MSRWTFGINHQFFHLIISAHVCLIAPWMYSSQLCVCVTGLCPLGHFVPVFPFFFLLEPYVFSVIAFKKFVSFLCAQTSYPAAYPEVPRDSGGLERPADQLLYPGLFHLHSSGCRESPLGWPQTFLRGKVTSHSHWNINGWISLLSPKAPWKTN